MSNWDKPEQDTSDWGLGEYHNYTGWVNDDSQIRIDAEDSMGVWIEFNNVDIAAFTQWIPPEVAEAIGTMLLYAAQKYREEFPNGYPQ